MKSIVSCMNTHPYSTAVVAIMLGCGAAALVFELLIYLGENYVG